VALARIESIGKPGRKSRKCKVALVVSTGASTTNARASIPERLLQGLAPGDSVPFLVAHDDAECGEPLAMVLSTCRLD
jgi:hypothetical protein